MSYLHSHCDYLLLQYILSDKHGIACDNVAELIDDWETFSEELFCAGCLTVDESGVEEFVKYLKIEKKLE